MSCKKECLRFNITLKLKAIHGRTHRNKIKKSVLTIDTYFKVSIPVRAQRQEELYSIH